jgi:hypothetical protein
MISLFEFLSLKDLNFATGEAEKIVTVQILPDDLPEPDETFQIILASPKNGLALGNPSVG